MYNLQLFPWLFIELARLLQLQLQLMYRLRFIASIFYDNLFYWESGHSRDQGICDITAPFAHSIGYSKISGTFRPLFLAVLLHSSYAVTCVGPVVFASFGRSRGKPIYI